MARQSSATRVARVLLRLPADLHRALTRAARAEGISFNEACVQRLRHLVDRGDPAPAHQAIVDRADRLFGTHVIGLVALGSVTRGDAAVTSDADVLVVLDDEVELTRALYRRWDEEGALTLNHRQVDAHFVTLAGDDRPPAAVWCEAAVDGEIWLDRGSRVAARLAAVRRAIAEGRVRRGYAHGQPYWKEVA
jgi:predicted nucleotidyltransferase